MPATEHGTHVAGVLTADWRTSDEGEDRSPEDHDLYGVARGLELDDLRVFDEQDAATSSMSSPRSSSSATSMRTVT